MSKMVGRMFLNGIQTSAGSHPFRSKEGSREASATHSRKLLVYTQEDAAVVKQARAETNEDTSPS